MVDRASFNPPVPIASTHEAATFDCGQVALNKYLQEYALQNHLNGSARTYVATRGKSILGYYTLAFGSVFHDAVPPRVRKGLGRYPIPVLLLARLAVDQKAQGQGLGKALLKDALFRTLQASEIAGLRALLVHAKDQNAAAFYHQYGFEPSPIDPFHLYLLMKDLKRQLQD